MSHVSASFIIVVSLLIAGVAQAAPTFEQQAWFSRLSPEEAGAVRQAYEDRRRMERWDKVRRVAVTDFVRTKDVRFLNPVDVIDWSMPVKAGERVKVWWVVEMPRNASTPFDIRVEWFHGSNSIRSIAYAVDKPSPAYRLHDNTVVRRLGRWTVRVTWDSEVLAEKSFNVH